MWLVALFGLALYWGALYINENAGGFNPLVFNQGDSFATVKARVPHSTTGQQVSRGRQVYRMYCYACHQANAQGIPGQFPPLAGSDWVNAPGPNRVIRIVLNGLHGPIKVSGYDFNNTMVPWRDQLNDEAIAEVLTYVRGNRQWGNTASPVTPAQVKAIRQATASRGKNWTAPELLQISDTN